MDDSGSKEGKGESITALEFLLFNYTPRWYMKTPGVCLLLLGYGDCNVYIVYRNVMDD